MSGEVELFTAAADKARRLAAAVIAGPPNAGKVAVMGSDAITAHLQAYTIPVGAAVADWLDAQAAFIDWLETETGDDPMRHADLDCGCGLHRQIAAALTFARTYMGVESGPPPHSDPDSDQEKPQ